MCSSCGCMGLLDEFFLRDFHIFCGIQATRQYGVNVCDVISISFLFGALALLWSIITACAYQRFIAYVAFEVGDWKLYRFG